jgi:thiamine biosynthesis lipoprotein
MTYWRTTLPLLRRSFLAMGTQITITIALGRRRRWLEAEHAIAELHQSLTGFGRDWWAWGPGALAGLNRQLAAGARIAITPAMQPLFQRAWQLRQASGGRFEPRVAALVRLWGFDEVARIRRAPPPPQEIETLLAALKRAPDYGGGDSYGPAPGIGWDFGGIAKGYIADRALDRLRELGFEDATLDAGGNIGVRGLRGGRPWRIGIRNPRPAPDAPPLLATLEAGDESVNTHGDDQRYFEYEGRRYSHILDPFTGMPARGLRSLTVVHPDGSVAEAAGAALFVAGPERWPALAAELGIRQALAVREDGVLQATPALARRLQPQPGISIEFV